MHVVVDARGGRRNVEARVVDECAHGPDRVARGDLPLADASREGLDLGGHVVAELHGTGWGRSEGKGARLEERRGVLFAPKVHGKGPTRMVRSRRCLKLMM